MRVFQINPGAGWLLLVTALRIHTSKVPSMPQQSSESGVCSSEGRHRRSGAVARQGGCLGVYLSGSYAGSVLRPCPGTVHHRVFAVSYPCVCERLRGGPAPLTLRRWCAQMHGTHGRLCDGAAALVARRAPRGGSTCPSRPAVLCAVALRVRSCASSDAVPFA